MKLILSESGRVQRVYEEFSVIANSIQSESEKLMSYGKFVEVEGNLFWRIEGFVLSTIDLVLLSLFCPCVVPILAVPVRHAEVRLLDPAENFFVERCLEIFRRLHHRLGVRIFRFEIGDNLGIGLFPKPEIIVDTYVTVERIGFGNFLCNRRYC